jgi:spore germination cell wall hydrolase CwlJ-like protein
MTDSLQDKEDFSYAWIVAYREARGEPMPAQAAVVYTLLNRAQRPKWWGHSIGECAVKAWQYSSMTDPRDPQLSKAWPTLSTPAGLATARVADEVLRGAVANPFPGADSYYDDSITAPNWTVGARFCGKLGKLNFYDVDHDYEAPVTGHV